MTIYDLVYEALNCFGTEENENNDEEARAIIAATIVLRDARLSSDDMHSVIDALVGASTWKSKGTGYLNIKFEEEVENACAVAIKNLNCEQVAIKAIEKNCRKYDAAARRPEDIPIYHQLLGNYQLQSEYF